MSILENLSKFFQADGKTVILPIDHGTVIPVQGLERPGEVIESVRKSVDGFVVNFGVAQACAKELEGKGICLRTDGYKPTYPGNPDKGSYKLFTAEDADAVDAHAMMNMCYLHHPREAENFQDCASVITEGRDYGIPVILEALPFSIGRPDDYTVENVGFAVRLAAELGANVVKTAYPTNGSVEEFRTIIDAALVPVIVLGGTAMGDDEALLTMVRNSMDAGASGIAVGRNVWQHTNPRAVAAALNAIVHDGAGVRTSLKLIG